MYILCWVYCKKPFKRSLFMLKKLVKYGNSNALILDKAILELLNIKEGATIKIKTDGKSIIITPHVKTDTQEVSETFTHHEASMESIAKEAVKAWTDTDKDQQKELEKELTNLMQEYQTLQKQLFQNANFFKDITQLKKETDATSPQFIEAYKVLRNKHCPQLAELDKKMAAFSDKKNEPSEKQKKAMEAELFTSFQKNKQAILLGGELLNNPKYQHEAQLLAEKYNFDKNSSDYLNAIDELKEKYHPEIKQAQEELKAISKKYSKK